MVWGQIASCCAHLVLQPCMDDKISAETETKAVLSILPHIVLLAFCLAALRMDL